MAVEDSVPVEQPQVEAEQDEPRSMQVTTCQICGRNAVDGRCAHCGYEPK